jgi:hypothetical protein
MAWQDTRAAGVATAAREAHSDDAKHRAHEGTRPSGATRSWRPFALAGGALVLVVVVLVALLVHRGSSDSTSPVASSSKGAGTKSSPSPATPSADPVQATQPSGRYRVTSRFLVVRPPDASNSTQPTTAQITGQSCTQSSCTGTLVSDVGSRYDYDWNGSTLRLTRGPTVTTARCTPSGSFDATRTYGIPSAAAVASTTSGPPRQITFVMNETVTYSRFKGGCRPDATSVRFDRRRVTLTQLP